MFPIILLLCSTVLQCDYQYTIKALCVNNVHVDDGGGDIDWNLHLVTRNVGNILATVSNKRNERYAGRSNRFYIVNRRCDDREVVTQFSTAAGPLFD